VLKGTAVRCGALKTLGRRRHLDLNFGDVREKVEVQLDRAFSMGEAHQ
jgi:hypothetical protein